jgi:osmotically-inducible protein OsmY
MNRRTALRTVMAAAGVTALAGCRGFVAPSPGGRRGGDGKPLSLAVQEAFRSSADTNLVQIEVYSTDEGVVILKGIVGTEAELYATERVALTVDGVRRVDNALYVR